MFNSCSGELINKETYKLYVILWTKNIIELFKIKGDNSNWTRQIIVIGILRFLLVDDFSGRIMGFLYGFIMLCSPMTGKR